MKKTILTPERIKFIHENYLQLSSRAMANIFNCHRSVVQRYIKKNGLVIPAETIEKFRIAGMIGRTTATKDEDAKIKAEYLIKPVKVIAAELKRGNTFVSKRLQALGLVIPREVIEQRIIQNRIKKGNIPLNKGRKQTDYMSAAQIAKTALTRFKKGDIPGNAYNEIGKITLHTDKTGRKYKYICLALAKWVPLHKHVWEEVNGPVPEGHCLWFKDGDTSNTDLSNLECITRRENRLRNSGSTMLSDKTIAHYTAGRGNSELKKELLNHPDILQIKRTQILLNRAINDSRAN